MQNKIAGQQSFSGWCTGQLRISLGEPGFYSLALDVKSFCMFFAIGHILLNSSPGPLIPLCLHRQVCGKYSYSLYGKANPSVLIGSLLDGHKLCNFLFSKAGKFKTSMALVPYNELLTNLQQLARTVLENIGHRSFLYCHDLGQIFPSTALVLGQQEVTSNAMLLFFDSACWLLLTGFSWIPYMLGSVFSWAPPSFQAPFPSSWNVDEFNIKFDIN